MLWHGIQIAVAKLMLGSTLAGDGKEAKFAIPLRISGSRFSFAKHVIAKHPTPSSHRELGPQPNPQELE